MVVFFFIAECRSRSRPTIRVAPARRSPRATTTRQEEEVEMETEQDQDFSSRELSAAPPPSYRVALATTSPVHNKNVSEDLARGTCYSSQDVLARDY